MISNLFQHLNIGKLALEPPALNPIGGCLLMLLAGLVAYLGISQRSRHHAKRLIAKYGDIAFAWAIRSKDLGLVRKIAAQNPDPNVILNGLSALGWAVWTRDADIVREVVKLRPDPYALGKGEGTALMAAVRSVVGGFYIRKVDVEILKEVLKIYPASELRKVLQAAAESDERGWELVVREILKQNVLTEEDLLEAMQSAKTPGTIREILKHM